MSTPLPTTGISGGISETGVATVEVPMFVDTLAEALSVLPNLGIGIPYRSRAFTQEGDGGFKVTLHFEGIADDAKDDDQVTFELDTSMAEDPIQTHPFFDTLKTRYAWDAAKEQFADCAAPSTGTLSRHYERHTTKRFALPARTLSQGHRQDPPAAHGRCTRACEVGIKSRAKDGQR